MARIHAGDPFEHWLAAHRPDLLLSTRKLYARIARRWSDEDETPEGYVGRLHQEIASGRRKPLAPSTLTTIRAAAAVWYDYAAGLDPPVPRPNPPELQLPTRRSRARPRALSVAELQDYRQTVRREVSEPYRTILLLLPETGLRISEMCELPRKAWVVEGRGSALVLRGKGDKERAIPSNRRARDLLKAYLRQAPRSSWMFPREDPEDHVLPDTTRGYLRQLRGSGVLASDITPHVLRHTFATQLQAKAVDPTVIQELMGHSSFATTQRYLHPSHELKQDAVDRLD